MFCEKCGKEIQEEAALCNECKLSEDIGKNSEIADEAIVADNINNDDSLANNEIVSESINTVDVEDHTSEAVESTLDSSEIEEIKLPKRIKEKRMRRVFAHIGASVLSIILAILLFITASLWVVRDVVSPDTIKEMINNIDLDEIKIDDIADKELLESHGLKCESDNLFDIIYDNIDQTELPNPISKDDFRAIVEDVQFREYFGEIFGTSIEALTSGDSSDVVTPHDVVDFLASNGDKFSEFLGYDLTEERLENLKVTLEKDYGQIFEAIGDKKLDTLVGNDFAGIINLIFADWLFWCLIAADILVCGLIFLVLRSVSSSVNYCASTFIVVGVLFLCVSALIDGLLSMFGSGPLVYVINQLVSVILWEMIIISIVMIVFAIGSIISVKIISRYKKRHVV